jgi:hypothetical protein
MLVSERLVGEFLYFSNRPFRVTFFQQLAYGTTASPASADNTLLSLSTAGH